MITTKLEAGVDKEHLAAVLEGVSGEDAQSEVEAAAAVMDEAAEADEQESVAADKNEEVAEVEASETSEDSARETQSEGAGPTEPEQKKDWDRLVRSENKARKLAEENKRFRGELDELKSRLDGFSKKPEDPIAALEAAGFTYEDATNRILNDGKASDAEVLRQLEARQQEGSSQLEEKVGKLEAYIQQREQQQLIDQYRGDIKSVLSGDVFQLLGAYDDAVDTVFQYASAYAAENGEVLDASAAAQHVQDELREEIRRLASHDAVKEILGVSGEKAKDTGKGETPKRAKSPKTLSNEQASAPVKSDIDWDTLDDDDRLREAAKLIQHADIE